MKSYLIFLYVTLLCVDLVVKSDPYDVIFKLQELVNIEKTLAAKVRTFLDKRLSSVRQDEVPSEAFVFVMETQARNNLSLEVNEYIANPVHAFHLLHRAAKDWDWIKDLLSCKELECPDLTGGDLINNHMKKHEKLWPKSRDLSDYTLSLIKLWKIYHLDLHELMRGNILGRPGEPLSLDDILFIASIAKDNQWYYEAIQWYNVALFVTQNDKRYKDKRSRVYKRLALCYDKSKMTWKAIDLMEELLSFDPDNAGAKRDLKFYKSMTVKKFIEELQPPKKRYANLKGRPNANYEALCRGEMKSPKKLSRLGCIFEKKMIPYAPLKAEIRNNDPLIVLYHDILTPKDLAALRKSSEVALKNPERNGYTEFKRPTTDVTHAHSVWLDDIITRNRNVSLKIEDVLGYSTILRRPDVKNTFQATTFAAGASFLPRWQAGDAIFREDVEDRPTRVVKRLVNVKIFLSDVEGGAVVFPYAKARVPITKRGAAVWIDDQTDDWTIRRTLSADCPVLRGVKWAATKWMHPIGIDMAAVPSAKLR